MNTYHRSPISLLLSFTLLTLLLFSLSGCLHAAGSPDVPPPSKAVETSTPPATVCSTETTISPTVTAASPETALSAEAVTAAETASVSETTSAEKTAAETTTMPETTALPETTAPPETPPPDPSKIVYLTFDDGPSRDKNEQVLQILAEYDIRATFFVVGMFVDYYPEQTRRIVEEGHALGCHSYTHRYETLYASPDAILADLAEWERAVTAALGELPAAKLYRFPGGTTGETLAANPLYPELRDAIGEAGYRMYDWTAGNNDLWLGMKTEEMTMEDYLMFSLRASLRLTEHTPALPKIILMHETSADTASALPAMLDYLIGEGYSFATLDEHPDSYLLHP